MNRLSLVCLALFVNQNQYVLFNKLFKNNLLKIIFPIVILFTINHQFEQVSIFKTQSKNVILYLQIIKTFEILHTQLNQYITEYPQQLYSNCLLYIQYYNFPIFNSSIIYFYYFQFFVQTHYKNMETLPFIVFLYLSFHAYMLKIYYYTYLSWHIVYILILLIYLCSRRQNNKYHIDERELLKKQNQKAGQSSNNNIKTCMICKRVKSERYYHCRRCNICIYRMDHHCQWVGNCIGQYNSKSYLHFLINLFVHHSLFMVYVFGWNFTKIFSNENRMVYLLILVLPSFFIIYQTQRLLKDWYFMVKQNQTLIQSYKRVKGIKQPLILNANEFLGQINPLFWAIPFYTNLETPQKYCNLNQTTFKVCQDQIDQHTYADEYIYGKDD